MALTNTDIGPAHRVDATPVPAAGWLAGIGATVGFGALAASSCCVLPLALAGLGTGGAVFSGLEMLANWRLFLQGSAALVLLAAWGAFLRRRSAVACGIGGSCAARTSSRSTRLFLSLGTAFVVLSLIWEPYIEPFLLKFMR